MIARVRGQHVQVLLSDAAAASDWPIAATWSIILARRLEEDEEEGSRSATWASSLILG